MIAKKSPVLHSFTHFLSGMAFIHDRFKNILDYVTFVLLKSTSVFCRTFPDGCDKTINLRYLTFICITPVTSQQTEFKKREKIKLLFFLYFRKLATQRRLCVWVEYDVWFYVWDHRRTWNCWWITSCSLLQYQKIADCSVLLYSIIH